MAKPWITPGIRASLKIKNNFYKRYINTRFPYYFSKVKSYRNRLNRLIKISKRDYYNNYFTINNKNMKNIWRGIKQIISIKPRVGGGIPSQIMEERSVLIAQSFNNFFANVGNNLAVSVPYEGGLNSIFLYPITSEEIEIDINKLNFQKPLVLLVCR
jgi:hypothetical protein